MSKCKIVAEIGINHNGNLEIAKRLINASKQAGADYVKFQLYDPKKVLREKDFSKEDWNWIVKSQLKPIDIIDLSRVADDANIGFMCSAFNTEDLLFLDYHTQIEIHKVASRILPDKSFLNAVEKLHKPFLISTGYVPSVWKSKKQWQGRVDDIIDQGHLNKILYCVAEYPTPLKHLHISERLGIYAGFSDHSKGISAAAFAIFSGAKYIEKHVTYNTEAYGPDHKASITIPDLERLCKIRDDFAVLFGGK